MEAAKKKIDSKAVLEAVVSLRNPKGSTAHDIKKYLVSTGKIEKSCNIGPLLKRATGQNLLLQQGGIRKRFLFWGSGSEAGGGARTGKKRKYRRGRKKKKKSKRKKKRSRRRRSGKRRSRRRGSKRKRSRKGSKRRGRRRSRSKGKSARKSSSKHHRSASGSRKGKEKSFNLKPPSGKEIVAFFARKKKKEGKVPSNILDKRESRKGTNYLTKHRL